MRRLFRQIGISLLCIISCFITVLLLLAATVLFLNHTNRLTPLASWYMNHHIAGKMYFDSLQFNFSAFPVIGVSARNGLLLSDNISYSSDTLCRFEEMHVLINPFHILQKKLIDIPYVYLKSPYALVALNKSGDSNWDMWRFIKKEPHSSAKETVSETDTTPIELKITHIILTDHPRFDYDNLHSGMRISADAQTIHLIGRIAINYKKLDADHLVADALSYRMVLPGGENSFQICADSIMIQKQIEQTFRRYHLSVNTRNDSLILNDKKLLTNERLSIYGNVNIGYDYKYIELYPLVISLKSAYLMLSGTFSKQRPNQNMFSDIIMKSKVPDIEWFLTRIPALQQFKPTDMKIDGGVRVNLHSTGPFSLQKRILPDMKFSAFLHNGTIQYGSYPALKSIDGILDGTYANSEKQLFLNINSLHANLLRSSFLIEGQSDNLLSQSWGKWAVYSNINISDIAGLLTDSFILKGKMLASMNISFHDGIRKPVSISELLDRTRIQGSGRIYDFRYMNDIRNSTSCKPDKSNKQAFLPLLASTDSCSVRWISDVKTGRAPEMNIEMSPLSVTNEGNHICIDSVNLRMRLADTVFSGRLMYRNLYYRYNDTLRLYNGTFYSEYRSIIDPLNQFASKKLMPRFLNIQTAVRNVIGQWNNTRVHLPSSGIFLNMRQRNSDVLTGPLWSRYLFDGGIILDTTDILTPVLPLNNRILSSQILFNNNELKINELSLQSGRSDMRLKAQLSGWYEYLTKKDTIAADCSIDADTLHLTQFIPALLKGMFYLNHRQSRDIDSMTNRMIPPNLMPPADTLSRNKERMLRISPLIKMKAEMNARSVSYNSIWINQLRGNLLVNNQTIMVQNMAATSDLGKVQLNASYQNVDSLQSLANVALTLNRLDLDDLLTFMPDIKKIVPMLSSLKGKIDCLLAGNAIIDSSMYIVLPSINGGSVITGHHLSVDKNDVMPRWIGRILFGQKKRIGIDSIQVKLTMKDNLLNIYPMQADVGRFQVLAQGIQNTDKSFFYHLSFQKGLLPFAVGLNIYSHDDKTKFRLTCPQLKSLSLPARVLKVSPNDFYPHPYVRKYIESDIEKQQSTFVRFLDYYHSFLKSETDEISQKQTADLIRRLQLLKNLPMSP